MQEIKNYKEEFGIELEKYFKFNSSHFVIYKETAETLHGHNYKTEVCVIGNKLNSLGMLIDFADLKL